MSYSSRQLLRFHLLMFLLIYVLTCSCLISRNLLNGLKTCLEVYKYMTRLDGKLSCQGGDCATSLDHSESMVILNGCFPVIMYMTVSENNYSCG